MVSVPHVSAARCGAACARLPTTVPSALSLIGSLRHVVTLALGCANGIFAPAAAERGALTLAYAGGHGSMVEYTVAPARLATPCSRVAGPRTPRARSRHARCLPILARREYDAITYEDRAHGPVAPGQGVLRFSQRLVHIIGIGHGRDCTRDTGPACQVQACETRVSSWHAWQHPPQR